LTVAQSQKSRVTLLKLNATVASLHWVIVLSVVAVTPTDRDYDAGIIYVRAFWQGFGVAHASISCFGSAG